jgi:hypothetical protein
MPRHNLLPAVAHRRAFHRVTRNAFQPPIDSDITAESASATRVFEASMNVLPVCSRRGWRICLADAGDSMFSR